MSSVTLAEVEERATMPELKACPFCGSKAEFFQGERRTSGHGETCDKVGVSCTGCYVKVEEGEYTDYKVPERVISTTEKWNRRA